MVKLLFFHFGVTTLRLKNKQFHSELLLWWWTFWLLSYKHKLINEKTPFSITLQMSVNAYKLITLLKFLRTTYNSITWVCSKVGVNCMWSPIDENLPGLCLGAKSLLVPETFIFKVLVIWLPAYLKFCLCSQTSLKQNPFSKYASK